MDIKGISVNKNVNINMLHILKNPFMQYSQNDKVQYEEQISDY